MRLSGLSLAVIFLFSSTIWAQHSSGGSGSSGGSSSSSSSGGGSHSSSSGGSSYSGGGSGGGHSSGGGSSYSGDNSHSSPGGHSASGNSSGANSSGGGHGSNGVLIPHGPGSRGSNEHGSNLVNTPRTGAASPAPHGRRPIREPKSGAPGHTAAPEKRTFFSFLRHPFRKAPPPQPALYLPRPICPKGRCAPACPVGQVRSGDACTTPVIAACFPGQIWDGVSCNQSSLYQCSRGQIWNGSACLYTTRFLDSCFGLRTALVRQAQRVQMAESIRQSACANGPAQECSEATAAWQSEENLRETLQMRYQQCQVQSMAAYSTGYGLSVYDSTRWFDSLTFELP